MDTKHYFITQDQLDAWLQELALRYRVFVPALKNPAARREHDYCYSRVTTQPAVYNPYRVVEPLKSFFTYVREKVSDYFTEAVPKADVIEETILFGVKNCDIVGHTIQDFVFLEGIETDDTYKARRDATLFIASDCTDFKDVCHCLAWDIMPYPVTGFDLSYAPVEKGYIFEIGSKKGAQLLEEYRRFFSPAQQGHETLRQRQREALVEKLRNHLAPQNLTPKKDVQKIMREGFGSDVWQQYMRTCVECGGCNLICDTCHCFLLADRLPQPGQSDAMAQKIRVWDSCLYANYARVAGGANPLKHRAQRLRNRFAKKFDFFVDVLKMPACCGCGRCIEVCPGKIDIREVLKSLAHHYQAKQETSQ